MNGSQDTGAVLPESSGVPLAIMVEADIFDVRRNAYFWAWQHQQRVFWHGEEEGNALWCASNYLARLLQKILTRKRSVDLATIQMMQKTRVEALNALILLQLNLGHEEEKMMQEILMSLWI